MESRNYISIKTECDLFYQPSYVRSILGLLEAFTEIPFVQRNTERMKLLPEPDGAFCGYLTLFDDERGLFISEDESYAFPNECRPKYNPSTDTVSFAIREKRSRYANIYEITGNYRKLTSAIINIANGEIPEDIKVTEFFW